MSRKGKNAGDIPKNNTIPVKPKDPTTARLEQLNTEEAEEKAPKIQLQENI